eukprot:10882792-Heterocapsa_arctica.AAC.1
MERLADQRVHHHSVTAGGGGGVTGYHTVISWTLLTQFAMTGSQETTRLVSPLVLSIILSVPRLPVGFGR